MPDQPKLVNVTMIRGDLDGIPDYPCPRPFALRLFCPGDEKAFEDIWLAADSCGQARSGLFEKEFGANLAAVRERMFFLMDGAGQPVGTAAAWFNDDFDGQRYGQVHWVAIRPEAQGRGLAKPLMSAVLNRMKELGHTRAYLVTQTVRLAAINLYLAFGFEPLIKTDDDKVIWQGVMSDLVGMKRAKKGE